jgi:uncharacterized protein YjbI with pentapeptide repeats
MAHPEHLATLKLGVSVWNRWRIEHPEAATDLRTSDFSGKDLRGVDLSSTVACNWWAEPKPGDPAFALSDFRRADLSGANLSGANLQGAVLIGANLCECNLTNADLSHANLSGAEIRGARLWNANLRSALLAGADLRVQWSRGDSGGTYLIWTDLTGADLTGSNLSGANLTRANLTHAILRSANLEMSILVRTNMRGADLTGCLVYGVSAWGVNLSESLQSNLVITPADEVPITVDNLKMAQFLHLLLNNREITAVFETVTSKVVLILGRFTPKRKAVLDGIREELRRRDYTPVLFDFVKLASQSTMETVSTLAGMARFAIADLTDAKSILQELGGIVPDHPSLAVQPILLSSQQEPGMFDFLVSSTGFCRRFTIRTSSRSWPHSDSTSSIRPNSKPES